MGQRERVQLDHRVPAAKMLLKWLKGNRQSFLWAMSVATPVSFALLSHFFHHYQSEGFLRASRPLTELNTQRATFEDKGNFLRYLRANKLTEAPHAAYLLQVIGPGVMQRQVRVVLPYTKEDLRFLSELKSPLDANILGYSIFFVGTSPEDAAARVKLMGDYLKDTMLRQDLLDSIHQRAGDVRAEKQKLDNKLIAKREELEEATRKRNALKEIAARYPEASKYESRQLLSADTDSSRFLSPMMQLVGVESNIADIRNDLVSLERDATKSDLRFKFYSAAEELESSQQSGRGLFDDFRRLRMEIFEEVLPGDDRSREVVNKIDLLAERLQTKHLVNTRFISGPSVPDHRSGLPIALLLALSILFGGLVAGAAVSAYGRVQAKKAKGPIGGIADPGGHI